MKRSSGAVHLLWIYDGDLARALDGATWLNTVSALRQSGWQVTLVAAGEPGVRTIRGVDVLCLWQPHVYLLRHIVFHLGVLRVILRQIHTLDIILFHEASAPWILPLRLFPRPRPLLVMDSRSLPMPSQKRWNLRDSLRSLSHRVTAQLGNRLADGRLAITRRLAEAIAIPPDKLWGTWPSGADLERFSKATVNRRWPTADQPIRIIYHGSLHRERNLMAACQAVVLANEGSRTLKLLLVGQGSQEAELRAFAQQHPESLRVMAPVPHNEMPELLAESHVGILPFPDDEKFRVSSPIKLFEYMASGMPVLATRVVCHTDVVDGGGYAFWAEASDAVGLLAAMHQVLACREELPTLGKKASAAAPDWTWDASAAKLRSALEARLER